VLVCAFCEEQQLVAGLKIELRPGGTIKLPFRKLNSNLSGKPGGAAQQQLHILTANLMAAFPSRHYPFGMPPLDQPF
jgi:hypothetical protein